MGIIAFIENKEVIKKILKRLDLWDVKPRPLPRSAKAQPLCTEPYINHLDPQVPLPLRVFIPSL